MYYCVDHVCYSVKYIYVTVNYIYVTVWAICVLLHIVAEYSAGLYVESANTAACTDCLLLCGLYICIAVNCS